MAAQHDSISKRCSKCGIFKPYDQFHRNTGGKGIGGRKAICKLCDRAYLTSYRASKRKPPVAPVGFHPETQVLDAAGRDWAWAFVWYKPVPFAPQYIVGSDGKVWSQSRHGQWVELKPCADEQGRLKVGLYVDGKTPRKKVHKIVMETFWGSCPVDMEVCHNNGDSSDNRLSNLRYGTHSSNMMDRVEHGTANRGDRHGLAKLTEPQVVEIIRRLAAGELMKDLAVEFHVSRTTISNISAGRAWGHLSRKISA